MNWLSFFIGALIGWLVGWLIDYFVYRPRRIAAEADLRAGLQKTQQESVSRQPQWNERGGVPGELHDTESLTSQRQGLAARQSDLEAELTSTKAETESLRSKLAETADLRAQLEISRAEAEQNRLEVERLRADMSASSRLAESQGATGARGFAMGNLEAGTEGTTGAAAFAGAGMTQPAMEPGEPDDLAIIEGIGPKIKDLLNANGILTFAQLADTSVERLDAILASGGSRFGIANPETWARQALLARDGNMVALKDYQDTLRGGRQG